MDDWLLVGGWIGMHKWIGRLQGMSERVDRRMGGLASEWMKDERTEGRLDGSGGWTNG